MTVTGRNLIGFGFFEGAALSHVRRAGPEGEALAAFVAAAKPTSYTTLQTEPSHALNLQAGDAAETGSVAAVAATMDALMRNPTNRAGAVIPDASPAGPFGTLPAGGAVGNAGAIHPGTHSAYNCGSGMISDFADADQKAVRDAVDAATHFGFIGRSAANGTTCLVTQHGSRGPGAGRYVWGIRVANSRRKRLSPATQQDNARIPPDTPEGEAYWDALHRIQRWTKASHTAGHASAAAAGLAMKKRFCNAHNLGFRRGDLFCDAKGATPIDPFLLPDTPSVQILPLNMAEPVLPIRGGVIDRNLGFAPHGAGRNLSRTAHKRSLGSFSEAQVFAVELTGIDARFRSGRIDVSELPSANKPAATLGAHTVRFGLAEVVGEVHPCGSIIAGNRERGALWRKVVHACGA